MPCCIAWQIAKRQSQWEVALHFTMPIFFKPGTIPSCMVHHGNVIISSGSPLCDFAQRHKNADRDIYSQKNTGTHNPGTLARTHTHCVVKGCTVPPSGLRMPLQYGKIKPARSWIAHLFSQTNKNRERVLVTSTLYTSVAFILFA